MRGKIKKLLLCLVGIILVSRVSALCDSCASRDEAFQICNMASGMPENCYIAVYPRSETLIDYDGGYFSIRDNIIYLNNSTVSIYVHADSIMGSEQILNFNITGDNIIKELNSITLSENTCKCVVDCLNLDYTYQPISITGDGSLEIEKTSILKRDTYGNQYYKCWTYSLIYGKKDRTTKCITKLTGPYAKSFVYNLYLPENGFTLSDLQDITYEDGTLLKSNGFDSLYYGNPGSTIESVMMISALTANSDPRWMSDLIELYNLNDTVLPVDFDLTAYDEDPSYRVQLITRLVNSGIIRANKPATSLNQITQDGVRCVLNRHKTRSTNRTRHNHYYTIRQYCL